MTAYLTIDQAASRLQCSHSTIKRMLSDGTLTRYKARRLTRIDPEELDRLSTKTPAQKPADNVVPFRRRGEKMSAVEMVKQMRGIG